MQILNLKQNNFRNLRQRSLNFSENVTLFIGENGQGKTNILEAVHLLLNGNSFRTRKSLPLIRLGEDQSYVEMDILKDNGLRHRCKLEFLSQKRRWLLNEKQTNQRSIKKLFPSILFSPESLVSIKEGPEERRILVDDWLIFYSPNNILLLKQYEKCLKTRNKLLNNICLNKANSKEKETLKDVLESINAHFLPLSTKLTQLRLNSLRDLFKDFQECCQLILGEKNTKIEIKYLISNENAWNWTEKEIYYALLKKKEALEKAEYESGTSLIGPNRHDIQFLFNRVDARYYCSQGQQRAMILAFKMAQIMYHYKAHNSYPVLLLDDVLSELDPRRRNQLLTFLQQIKAQIIMTATDLEFKLGFERDKLTIFHVSQGEITENVERSS